MYYLRTKPAAQAIQFTVDKTKLKQANKQGEEKTAEEVKSEENMAAMVCSLQNKDDCLMCGS